MEDHNNIFYLTHMIEQITNENIVRFSKEFVYPIGISTIIVLGEIAASGPIKQIDLADRLGYSKSSITNIANKLANLELIRRIYDSSDRRTVQLEITDKGYEALEESKTLGDKIYKELFSILSEEELLFYIEIQKKLLAQISNNKRLSF